MWTFFNACGLFCSFEGHLLFGVGYPSSQYFKLCALWISTRKLKLSFISHFVTSLCPAWFMAYSKFIFRIRILLYITFLSFDPHFTVIFF